MGWYFTYLKEQSLFIAFFHTAIHNFIFHILNMLDMHNLSIKEQIVLMQQC